MQPQNRKAEFEDAKAKAAEALAKGDPQAAIDQCVMQFSTAVFYCEESEGAFNIDVVRIGSANHRVYVEYTTENGSASARRAPALHARAVAAYR